MARSVRMVALESSSIAAVGYDAHEEVLRVRYVGGRTYDYLDVPAAVFKRLVSASSKGQFVNWHIKPLYAYRRVR